MRWREKILRRTRGEQDVLEKQGLTIPIEMQSSKMILKVKTKEQLRAPQSKFFIYLKPDTKTKRNGGKFIK